MADLDGILFALAGWIVALLGILVRTRQNRRLREDVNRLTGRVVHLIQTSERQKEPLHRIVALSRPGSEMRDEAVTALQMASTAVEEVIRAEPQLKTQGVPSSASANPAVGNPDEPPDGFAASPSTGPPDP